MSFKGVSVSFRCFSEFQGVSVGFKGVSVGLRAFQQVFKCISVGFKTFQFVSVSHYAERNFQYFFKSWFPGFA